MGPPSNPCMVVSVGRMAYGPAWELQAMLHQRVADGLLPAVLLLVEHPHVYTLGRRGKDSDILISAKRLRELGAEVFHVDRGGEVTYHGPGQLVGYPILNLRAWGGGPLEYVRALEQTLVMTLGEFGIEAESADRPTGVWVGEAKISAIGVKVARGVTMHGFALNVDPDLSYFEHIVACGMPDAPVTSMARELGPGADPLRVADVGRVVARQFGEAFGVEIAWSTLEELGEAVEGRPRP